MLNLNQTSIKQRITAKLSTLDTQMLIDCAKGLNKRADDEASISLNFVTEELQKRLSQDAFIAFCNKLTAQLEN